jgi:hypothetical protein
MRMRSEIRLDSASSARVARSSELSRRCSSRASTCWRATSDAMNTITEDPRYSPDWITAKPSVTCGNIA